MHTSGGEASRPGEAGRRRDTCSGHHRWLWLHTEAVVHFGLDEVSLLHTDDCAVGRCCVVSAAARAARRRTVLPKVPRRRHRKRRGFRADVGVRPSHIQLLPFVIPRAGDDERPVVLARHVLLVQANVILAAIRALGVAATCLQLPRPRQSLAAGAVVDAVPASSIHVRLAAGRAAAALAGGAEAGPATSGGEAADRI